MRRSSIVLLFLIIWLVLFSVASKLVNLAGKIAWDYACLMYRVSLRLVEFSMVLDDWAASAAIMIQGPGGNVPL